MAEEDKAVTLPDPVAPTEFPLSLEEYCANRSSTDRRVELIGGFYHVEKVAGRLFDTPTNYDVRYESFRTSPIE